MGVGRSALGQGCPPWRYLSSLNAAYSVVQYDVGEEEHAVKAIVKAKLQQYPEGSVVVYARTIKEVKKIAAYTGG